MSDSGRLTRASPGTYTHTRKKEQASQRSPKGGDDGGGSREGPRCSAAQQRRVRWAAEGFLRGCAEESVARGRWRKASKQSLVEARRHCECSRRVRLHQGCLQLNASVRWQLLEQLQGSFRESPRTLREQEGGSSLPLMRLGAAIIGIDQRRAVCRRVPSAPCSTASPVFAARAARATELRLQAAVSRKPRRLPFPLHAL